MNLPGAFYGEKYSVIFISKAELERWGRGLDDLLATARFTRAGLRFTDDGAARTVHRRISQRIRSAISAARRKEIIDEQEQYHTNEDLKVIWDIQAGRCYYSNVPLGTSFETSSFSVDHIDPISNGGHDGPLNLALTTAAINRKKWHRSKRLFLKKLALSQEELDRIWMIDNARKAHFYMIDRTKDSRSRRPVD